VGTVGNPQRPTGVAAVFAAEAATAALLVPSVAGHLGCLVLLALPYSSAAPIFSFTLTAGAAGVIVAAERAVGRRVAAVAADIQARCRIRLQSCETLPEGWPCLSTDSAQIGAVKVS
jgi:hypothetical protein